MSKQKWTSIDVISEPGPNYPNYPYGPSTYKVCEVDRKGKALRVIATYYGPNGRVAAYEHASKLLPPLP